MVGNRQMCNMSNDRQDERERLAYLYACNLLCGLEGHTLLVLGISIFCEGPPATAGITSADK